MKKSAKPILLLVAIILVSAVCVFTACGETNPPVYYTVAFDTNGAGTIDSQNVEDGGLATAPAQPQKTGYVFGGWYNGETLYDFSLPVKSNLTLTAKWSDRYYTVTFKSNGETLSTENVVHGGKVAKPSTPQRQDYYFNGWLSGGSAYDFNEAVTCDLTIEADWISNATLSSALQTALSADYSNYTMAYTVTEIDDGIEYSMTYTYKRDGNDYYTKLEQEGLPTVERWVVFGSDGKPLDYFYKNNNGEWKRGNGDVIHYYIPFKYTEITAADFRYNFGEYVLDEDSMSYFEYETFGTINGFALASVYVTIDGGLISHIEGTADDGILSFTQDVAEVGTTELTRPELPKSVVTITKNTLSGEETAGVKTVEEGAPITMTSLKALFSLKIDGVSHSEKITDNAINIGTLNLENPVAGTYTITLSYTAWDCTVAVTETATVYVKSAQPSVKTLADILAEDYTNATIKISAYTIVRDGSWYDFKSGTSHFYLWVDGSFDDGYARAVIDSANNISVNLTGSQWKQFLRLDLVTSLDADLFADNGDGTYTLGSDSDISQSVKDTLLDIFINAYSSKPIVGSIKMDGSKPYSLTLEVADDVLSKVTVKYYYGNSEKTFAFSLSKVGETDAIDNAVKTRIQAAFQGYTVTYKSGEHGSGADAVYEEQSHGNYILAENPFTAESGYVFIGWKEEGSAASDPVIPVTGAADYKLTKDTVFVAQWSVAYTVTYQSGDRAQGEDITRENLPQGDYRLESFDSDKWSVESGYTFAGWKLEGTDNAYQPDDTYNLAANTVFVAQWQATGSDTPTYTIASAIGLGSSPMKMVSEIQINEATGEITFTYTTSSNPTAQTITVTATKGDYYFESDQYAGYQICDSQISTSYTYVIKLSDDKSTLEVWDWNDDDGYAETCVGTFTKA